MNSSEYPSFVEALNVALPPVAGETHQIVSMNSALVTLGTNPPAHIVLNQEDLLQSQEEIVQKIVQKIVFIYQ